MEVGRLMNRGGGRDDWLTKIFILATDRLKMYHMVMGIYVDIQFSTPTFAEARSLGNRVPPRPSCIQIQDYREESL